MNEAAQAFESALTLSPNAAEPYYYLGLIAWADGHDAQAADLWQRALALRQNFPEANFMVGEGLRKNHRASESVEFYRRAFQQDPSKFVYYARLGGVYLVLGQFDQAREVFSLGLHRFPSLPEAHYFLGIAARGAADYEQAEAELRKSLSLEPNNVNALAQLGFVLLERDRMAEAETKLRSAIKINDKHFYANYDLGRLLVKSRRYEEALPILQHAVMLKPNNSSVHYQLFMALTRLKRKDAADRELATFKQLDEERKARPTSELEPDDEDAENPASTLPP
jgi:tetratricopeptide (TPR) repeat protein